MVQQMRCAPNLETAGRRKELALGVHVMPREEIAQTDRRRRHKGKHESSSSMGWVFHTNIVAFPDRQGLAGPEAAAR
jgi:hypothetical protein